ncbi:ubiquinol oxidase subunit II [Methylobacterium radiotolerans]|jgi:cytochrome d ubiquinol oxidase subunit II|uniref:cytochrome d ubiquinol oxidase subunit II n=1 Tax=unclassified Methylobacterium TaxID=2615210 RepID=UPI0005BB7E2F|nr:cytochrome d ubiquinol oxidase subunit II [Methylobacterium sp. 092160098-2]KIU26675.1 ubiquinol oxidase subunit II [Methylobacterium radiotolerans]MDE4916226.1 cytochrome d ubiquinol oxidase subunit II [Methylobacterium sp. 092160098-2]
MSYSFDLTVVWAFIIAFAVFAYIVMDGFDLGIGILFPAFRPGPERDTAMNSVAPVWDGNETWLVLGGGGLFAAFPLAYAIIMPALYAPIIAMLLGLVFRGVAFEFRWRDPRHRALWDVAFTGGSVVATLAQGIALGALLQGIKVEGRAYAGGWWDWFSPFSILVGIGLLCGYALLGATWLVMRTEGPLHDRARTLSLWLGAATVLAIAAVSAVTPFLEGQYWQRWFAMPNVLLTTQVPLLVAVAGYLFFRTLKGGSDRWPFLIALGLFLLSFIGLGISIFPDVVPGRVSIWQAAAPHSSQVFVLVGAAVLIPTILIYTAYSYWVFRGKVDAAGYH